jgi:hypothetical protein
MNDYVGIVDGAALIVEYLHSEFCFFDVHDVTPLTISKLKVLPVKLQTVKIPASRLPEFPCAAPFRIKLNKQFEKASAMKSFTHSSEKHFKHDHIIMM